MRRPAIASALSPRGNKWQMAACADRCIRGRAGRTCFRQLLDGVRTSILILDLGCIVRKCSRYSSKACTHECGISHMVLILQQSRYARGRGLRQKCGADRVHWPIHAGPEF